MTDQTGKALQEYGMDFSFESKVRTKSIEPGYWLYSFRDARIRTNGPSDNQTRPHMQVIPQRVSNP
jgi:hypothetical protein